MKIFVQDDARIVFWNDPEKEFTVFIQSHLFLTLGDRTIQVIRLDQTGTLDTKIRIERHEPEAKFLIYSPEEEPDYETDWLLDIRLYSRSFRADRASIILDELKLSQQTMRLHIANRRKFFDSKERLQKLITLVDPNDTEDDLDRKMISIAVRADQPEWFNILLTLFHAYTENRTDCDLDTPPGSWEAIEKFDLAATFWRIMEKTFGYSEVNPNLKNMLIRLMVTDLAHYLKEKLPTALVPLEITGTARSNVIVFLAQWRDSSSRAISYDKLSAEIEDLIHLEDHLGLLDINTLRDIMTFREIEKKIASDLKRFVIDHAEQPDMEFVQSIATRRQAGHWASESVTGAIEIKRSALFEVYNALVAAAELFLLQSQTTGFKFETASDMFQSYINSLYRIDQLYRHFCVSADHVQAEGWGILKDLRESIERTYSIGFLKPLALAWDRFIDPSKKNSLLTSWKIDRIPNQHQFYKTFVTPRLEESEHRRVFVIISDAFRYEAAHELTDILNGKYRYEAELNTQLGVLPSYTALGMASLLPHKTISIRDNSDVSVDGRSTGSFDLRQDILGQVQGICIRSKDLLTMRQEDGRNLIADRKVVYIYHDTIDSTGDSASSENRAFHAVKAAIDELTAIVTFVINNLNATYIVVTADHGFYFTETPPGEPDKSKLDYKPENAIKAKKRYIIDRHLGEHDSVWHGQLSTTAGVEGDVEFWVPRSVNLFHFSGGARFIHGGATLQEIVVPVVIVKQVKGKAKKETRTKLVQVSILGSNNRITTGQHRFELIQTEPVSDRVKAVTIKIAVYEGDDPVTNIEKLTFDSTSDRMDDRRKWITLVLQKRDFSKSTPYRLVLRDADTGIEIASMPVIIDRAFHDDF